MQGKNRDEDIEDRLWTLQGKKRVRQIERVALKHIQILYKFSSVAQSSLTL